MTDQLNKHRKNIDIPAELFLRKQIAHIWSVEDVQEVRPELDEEQAWCVLQEVDRQKDATLGITWGTLEIVADILYSGDD